MSSEQQKRCAAEAALAFVRPGEILGVGTGSTVNHFIDWLGERMVGGVRAAVSSSEASATRLRAIGIDVLDLNEVRSYALYVDGADEFEPSLALLKGGGGALTGEKIVAAAAAQFVCIVDASKKVEVLGAFPLPVEVLSVARETVAAHLRELGGEPVEREGLVTGYGNLILDVHGLEITDPVSLETEIETIPGVVTCGIFARRRADLVLMGTDEGVERFE